MKMIRMSTDLNISLSPWNEPSTSAVCLTILVYKLSACINIYVPLNQSQSTSDSENLLVRSSSVRNYEQQS